jgi:hypothetical protein
MIARGKREARRPWIEEKIKERALKVRNIIAIYYALSELHGCLRVDPGATRLALLGACPWLSYFAPLALHRPDFRLLVQSLVSEESSQTQHNIEQNTGGQLCGDGGY